MSDGLLLFARYAYPPNLLGYCGPKDNAALLGYLREGSADGGLTEIARRFEGAYPYLALIARANGIPDAFDRRVVEAYWVGNELLERVGAVPFFESLASRFRPRMPEKSFSWLTSILPHGAKPHHNFHVFDVYRRAGLMRDDRAAIALDRMDQCRISWGTVLRDEGAAVVVNRPALTLTAGRMALGQPVTVTVNRHVDARGNPDAFRPGETVSLHWDWACDRLSPRALAALVRSTRRAIAQANTTL